MQFPEVSGWWSRRLVLFLPTENMQERLTHRFICALCWGIPFSKTASWLGVDISRKKGVGEDQNLWFALVPSLLEQGLSRPFQKVWNVVGWKLPFFWGSAAKMNCCLPVSSSISISKTFDRTYHNCKMGQRSTTETFFSILRVHIAISSVSVLGIVCCV